MATDWLELQEFAVDEDSISRLRDMFHDHLGIRLDVASCTDILDLLSRLCDQRADDDEEPEDD